MDGWMCAITDLIQVQKRETQKYLILTQKNKTFQQLYTPQAYLWMSITWKDRHVVIYDTKYGTISGAHFHKFWLSWICSFTQHYAHYSTENRIMFNTEWRSLPYLISSWAGPVAMVRPVRPWPYWFLRDTKWHCLDSNLHVHYRIPSPSSSP